MNKIQGGDLLQIIEELRKELYSAIEEGDKTQILEVSRKLDVEIAKYTKNYLVIDNDHVLHFWKSSFTGS